MTSLAKQLQRLAVPHTQVALGEDRWKASLLFDPKEAAAIDKETYHALGICAHVINTELPNTPNIFNCKGILLTPVTCPSYVLPAVLIFSVSS